MGAMAKWSRTPTPMAAGPSVGNHQHHQCPPIGSTPRSKILISRPPPPLPVKPVSMSAKSDVSGIQKSKSGCLTCKQRHVKCDQQRPRCRRCTQGKRDCTYNPFAAQRATRQITRWSINQASSPNRLLSSFTATQQEWQAYSFYLHRVSQCIGGELDNEFWHTTVLQISQTQPAVRYALFTIGDLFRHIASCPTTYDDYCGCRHYRAALKHYNRSIASLKDQLVVDDVTVLAYVLYTCIECLQGNDQNVLSLIRQGSHMLVGDSPRQISTSRVPTIAYLNPLFSRLHLLSTLFAQPLQANSDPEYRTSLELTHFDSLSEARNVLYSLMNNVVGLQVMIGTAQGLSPTCQTPSAKQFLQWKRELETNLKEWHFNFTELGAAISPSCSQGGASSGAQSTTSNISGDDLLYASLESYYLVARLWLATNGNDSVSCYDQFLGYFRQIVDNAEKCLQPAPKSQKANHQASSAQPAQTSSQRPNSPQNSQTNADCSRFSFDLGFLPILFFTCLHCRDAETRQRAFALLYLTADRELIWDKAEIITVAKRVIELEESPVGRRYIYGVSTGARYRRNGIVMVDVTYRYRRPGMGRAGARGTGGRWALMTETLSIVDTRAQQEDRAMPSVVWGCMYREKCGMRREVYKGGDEGGGLSGQAQIGIEGAMV